MVVALVAAATACGDAAPTRPTPTLVTVGADARGEGRLAIVTSLPLDVGTVVGAFESASGCRVSVQPSGAADLLVLEGTALGDLVDAGDLAALPGDAGGAGDALAPVADGLPAIVDGTRYAVPVAWGADVLLYAPAELPVTPTAGWATLYDPALTGRIVVPDSPLELATAALVVGVGDPYALAPADLQAARHLLERQHPLVRGYWTSPADLGGLFASRKIAVAKARSSVAALVPSGVASLVPAGPTTGWSAWFAEPVRATHPVCAARWLEYVADPIVQTTLARSLGGSPTSNKACDAVGATVCHALRLDDRSLLAAIHLARRPDGYASWRAAWFALRG